MKRSRILKGSLIAVLVLGVVAGAWWLTQERGDDRTRIDTPISDPVGEVEPVLEVVTENIGQIWGIDFIPDSSQLVATVRSGSLHLIDTNTLATSEIAGVPAVSDAGQGGLLDVAVSKTFDDDNLIFLTYSVTNETGDSTTRLARAELNVNALELNNVDVLYTAEPFLPGTNHYGSRVVHDGGYIYMTIGDRNDKNFSDHVSQDTSNALGSTIRLLTDGSIPIDNPFVNDPNALDEIYSYGHRNAQGMAIQPNTGNIWQSEHGERDGDEINRIVAGGNHGWPIATTGCRYGTLNEIGERPEDRDDTINPVFYWECGTGGFPPAGMAFYDADGFVDWQGDLFVGGLASQYLAHFEVGDDGNLREKNPLLDQEGWRVRDVTVSNVDGAIYAAVEGSDINLVRITPRPAAD